ncbi:hypothetical protein V493_05922, partial [Pseudogymnoascus sp. VKM F-4281 (FW-2241)]
MSAEVLTTISPTTNKGILKRVGATPASLSTIADQSTSSFKTWSKTTLSERQYIVKKALEILLSKKDEYAKELTEQMGRPIAYTGVEVATAAKRGEYLLKISEEALGDTPGEEEKGFRRYIKKAPIGPVLILFAWN